MSFGLTNAMTHFMYLMNSGCMSELDKFIVVFIDDILVYSKNRRTYSYRFLIIMRALVVRQVQQVQVLD
jgi:hypothetical protein